MAHLLRKFRPLKSVGYVVCLKYFYFIFRASGDIAAKRNRFLAGAEDNDKENKATDTIPLEKMSKKPEKAEFVNEAFE